MSRFRAAAAVSLFAAIVVSAAVTRTYGQASRPIASVERRVQVMDQQAKQYEIDRMANGRKAPAVDARRAREIKAAIAADLNGLQSIYNEIVVILSRKQEPGESKMAEFASESRKMAMRLRTNLAFVKPESAEPLGLPTADTQLKTLRTLAKLIADLLTNPVFESTSGLDMKQAAQAALQLDALIEFTDPERTHMPQKSDS